MTHAYQPPVAELLSYGETHVDPDYEELFGFTAEHVPELIRMATDPALNEADSDSEEVWAPVHAWRVLGTLRAGEAAEPLVELLATLADDDLGDLAENIAKLGAPAYPPLLALLNDATRPERGRGFAADALSHLASGEPALRDQIVEVLTDKLASAPEREIVDSAASGLLDLKVVEAAPAFKQALDDGRLDPWLCGDWEDVQIELGLLEGRITPPPPSPLEQMLLKQFGNDPARLEELRAKLQDPVFVEAALARIAQRELGQEGPLRRPARSPAPHPGSGQRDRSAAAKRKMAKASRKKNRKRR